MSSVRSTASRGRAWLPAVSSENLLVRESLATRES
jgi:hypothetical protein